MAHIMVIDDDKDIGNLLETALTAQGYAVSHASDGMEALELLRQQTPDLILLDLMMPRLSGEQLLPKISGIPVIVVSARFDVDSKVSLLMGGAADYITKPFQMKELLARISVQLRKNSPAETAEIVLNSDLHSAEVAGETIRLTRTEYAILKMLLQNPAQVVTKSALLERIFEETPDCTESSLKQHISNLRRKLRAVSGKDYIEAVWGIGFKMKLDEK